MCFVLIISLGLARVLVLKRALTGWTTPNMPFAVATHETRPDFSVG